MGFCAHISINHTAGCQGTTVFFSIPTPSAAVIPSVGWCYHRHGLATTATASAQTATTTTATPTTTYTTTIITCILLAISVLSTCWMDSEGHDVALRG